jgi:hypothetical protein
MQKLFGFLMVGFTFTILNVATAEAQVGTPAHPCHGVEPAQLNGHACWPEGTDPSVSNEGNQAGGDAGAGALEGVMSGAGQGDNVGDGIVQTDRDAEWEGGNTTTNAQGRAESGSAARTQ